MQFFVNPIYLQIIHSHVHTHLSVSIMFCNENSPPLLIQKFDKKATGTDNNIGLAPSFDTLISQVGGSSLKIL